MIRRLLLALLVVCLALPAMAVPSHCAGPTEPVAAMHSAGHSEHGKAREAPAGTAGLHDCIGCVAPFAGATCVAAPEWFAAVPPALRSPLPIVGQGPDPATPPPRA